MEKIYTQLHDIFVNYLTGCLSYNNKTNTNINKATIKSVLNTLSCDDHKAKSPVNKINHLSYLFSLFIKNTHINDTFNGDNYFEAVEYFIALCLIQKKYNTDIILYFLSCVYSIIYTNKLKTITNNTPFIIIVKDFKNNKDGIILSIHVTKYKIIVFYNDHELAFNSSAIRQENLIKSILKIDKNKLIGYTSIINQPATETLYEYINVYNTILIDKKYLTPLIHKSIFTQNNDSYNTLIIRKYKIYNKKEYSSKIRFIADNRRSTKDDSILTHSAFSNNMIPNIHIYTDYYFDDGKTIDKKSYLINKEVAYTIFYNRNNEIDKIIFNANLNTKSVLKNIYYPTFKYDKLDNTTTNYKNTTIINNYVDKL